MDTESFESLLAALHSDSAEAAQAYRRLHQRLARFFSLHVVTDPEALADEAVDRLARGLVSRGSEEISSPTAFALGIARHLLHEEQRRRMREIQAAKEQNAANFLDSEDNEKSLQAMDRCLAHMPAERRQLLLDYYAASGAEKIAQHKRMAERMGLAINALRNRLLRARAELAKCMGNAVHDVPDRNDILIKLRALGKERR